MSIIQRSLLAAGAVAAASGLAVTSASATSQVEWTVVNPHADGSFSGSLKAGTYADVTDVSTSQVLECQGAEAKGSAPSGAYSDGAGLVDITTFSWGEPKNNKCHGPLGIAFTAELASTGMGFKAESYHGGIVSGQLADVDLAFTGETLFGDCTMKITGSLNNVTYNNATGELSIVSGTGLTMSHVNENCLGLLNNGDSVAYSATYVLKDPITVTSP
ncbi:hypothetical protein ACFYWO_03995 [Streptomyces sp. NPDC002932]|uniref:hypothetical protein n=1 Tax=Streptomyces sp. NPDC002932 TaxID=3364672 RepID=UPI00367AEA8C